MSQIKESINLIQGYYSYFLLSLYTDVLMKGGQIPLPTADVVLPTTTTSGIKLNTKRITLLLNQIKESPKSKNVYGYLGYISSMKGLLGAFLDLHNRSSSRRTYLKKTLGMRYDAYMQCIRLARNFLTHQHSADVKLSNRDLLQQRDKLGETGKRIISMTFQYKDIFGTARKGSDSYGFHISINTATLQHKRTLFDIIDEHTLFMLAESVYNITDNHKEVHKK